MRGSGVGSANVEFKRIFVSTTPSGERESLKFGMQDKNCQQKTTALCAQYAEQEGMGMAHTGIV